MRSAVRTAKRNANQKICSGTPPKKSTPEKRTPKKRSTAPKQSTARKLVISDNEPEDFDNFEDETAAIACSALEAYFMQGKTASERMNRSRNKRRNNPSIDDVEDSDSDRENLCGAMFKCNLGKLKDYIIKKNESDEMETFVENLDVKEMAKWTLYLAAGFNILLHGIGSKRDVIDRFVASELKKFTYMRINARMEDVTPKSVLSAINHKMGLNCTSRGLTLVEWAKEIRNRIAKSNQQLILVIDNIEAQDWRNDQDMICALVEDRSVIKLVATVDHVYSTFIWNSRQLSLLNLIHVTVNTMQMPLHELITGESRLLGLDARSNHSSHTTASLDAFWKSLASNHQKLLQLFYSIYFKTKKPVSFWDLFDAAKKEFIASTDTVLRTQLVEFKDHRIISWTRSDDGNDQVSGTVDETLMTKFLASKGMPIEQNTD
ncbi:unnamed protein product [Caenorhabditis bovis]|uniref:Origin recognition complex subunit 2 n=1 Tax=Caenorhabditis bovis TaxID=2654633 RepID=A0A8S1F149_9PELO|nr:unnamed protein product [Caenorhabditis bovis]